MDHTWILLPLEKRAPESVQPMIFYATIQTLSLPKEAFLFSVHPESASVVAAKVEAIARGPQISLKGLLRVSWNAAHIAVKPTRVCGKMDFSFGWCTL